MLLCFYSVFLNRDIVSGSLNGKMFLVFLSGRVVGSYGRGVWAGIKPQLSASLSIAILLVIVIT